MHIDDGEAQNNLLKVAEILCHKLKGEKEKIQDLRILPLNARWPTPEKKDCLELMNKELAHLKSAWKQFDGKTKFYDANYADLTYSCWISVCIIVECYHNLIQEESEFTSRNGKIFKERIKSEYSNKIITVDRLLQQCSNHIRNPMMHKRETPLSDSTASLETMAAVFDKDKAYHLILLLNTCEKFSLEEELPNSRVAFFSAESGRLASGPSGEPPRKERWMAPST